jgi:hypothetical protein
MSLRGSLIGWKSCLMKQMLLVRIHHPLLCGHVKKKKKLGQATPNLLSLSSVIFFHAFPISSQISIK